MKKILLILMLLLSIAACASAAHKEITKEGERYHFTYPVFTLEKGQAASRINKDIQGYVDLARKQLRDRYIQLVSSDYQIMREDERYLSLTFTTRSYVKGAAHGSSYTYGLVYDKSSGLRLPYTHFLPPIMATQLRAAIMNKQLPVYCADLKTPSNAPFIVYDQDFKVSENYIITPDARFYLLYQPYELDSYAAGVTYVKLN